MEVIDINGCSIEVTDLDKAIEQAEWFKDCHHEPPKASDKARRRYWRDLYKKLCVLKSALTCQDR